MVKVQYLHSTIKDGNLEAVKAISIDDFPALNINSAIKGELLLHTAIKTEMR